jgi:hypothetical protein
VHNNVLNHDHKTCWIIGVKADTLPPRTNHLFQDAGALLIFENLASSLRQLGYKITSPKRGKACDAVFRCELDEFTITTILVFISLEGDNAIYQLLTWPKKPLFSKLRKVRNIPEVRWRELCAAIDQQLHSIPGLSSLRWLTRVEARNILREANYPQE